MGIFTACATRQTFEESHRFHRGAGESRHFVAEHWFARSDVERHAEEGVGYGERGAARSIPAAWNWRRCSCAGESFVVKGFEIPGRPIRRSASRCRNPRRERFPARVNVRTAEVQLEHVDTVDRFESLRHRAKSSGDSPRD
jgi:hypothetical protein